MKLAMKAIVFITVLSLVSCAPRGESKSVAQLLADAKAKYSSTSKAGLDAGVDKSLTDLVAKLAVIEKGDDAAAVKNSAKEVALILNPLVEKAGYTQRPAMNELAQQFMALSESSADHASLSGSSRLLASRTYMLLAAELETLKFKL